MRNAKLQYYLPTQTDFNFYLGKAGRLPTSSNPFYLFQAADTSSRKRKHNERELISPESSSSDPETKDAAQEENTANGSSKTEGEHRVGKCNQNSVFCHIHSVRATWFVT